MHHRVTAVHAWQGLAIELIDAIRIYKESRHKHKHALTLPGMHSSQADRSKDLSGSFALKAQLLQERAGILTGQGKAVEARPLLLQARVFFKAAAYLERTPHPLYLSNILYYSCYYPIILYYYC